MCLIFVPFLTRAHKKMPHTARVISRRNLFKAALRGGIGVSALSLGTVAYATEIERRWFDFSRYDVVLPHLPAVFEGFRLVHLTDLHVECETMRDNLASVCEQISALSPDAVVVTGDFFNVSATAKSSATLREGFARLKAKDGIWGVLGNHDIGHEQPKRRALAQTAIRDAGIGLLVNEIHTIRRENQTLTLAGFDDFWHGDVQIEALAAQIAPGSAAIALGHEPDFASEVARTGKFGLMLAGHSHGGQICWPGGRPIMTPPHGEKFPSGWYRVPDENGGQMQLLTNRGLGTTALDVRFFCRPEVAILTLRCA